MVYLLDGAVVLILIVTITIGWCRGLVRYVFDLLGTIAAFVLAVVGSNALAEPVYDNFIRQDIVSSLADVFEDYDLNGTVWDKLDELGVSEYVTEDDVKAVLQESGDMSENLGELLDEKGIDSETVRQAKEEFEDYFYSSVPLNIRSRLETVDTQKLSDTTELTKQQTEKLVKALAVGDVNEAAVYAEETFVSPVAVGIVRTALFILIVAVVELLIKLILWISGIFTKLPEVSALNRLGGLVLGALKGCLDVAVIAFLLTIVVNFSHNSLEVFNADIAEKTCLFRYFFDIFYR